MKPACYAEQGTGCMWLDVTWSSAPRDKRSHKAKFGSGFVGHHEYLGSLSLLSNQRHPTLLCVLPKVQYRGRRVDSGHLCLCKRTIRFEDKIRGEKPRRGRTLVSRRCLYIFAPSACTGQDCDHWQKYGNPQPRPDAVISTADNSRRCNKQGS